MDENIENNSIDPKSNTKQKLLITIISIVLVAVLAVSSALLVKKYILTTFIVDGISMYPTLDGGNGAISEGTSEKERTNGEILYLNKVAKIKRGDIVVFSPEWPDVMTADGKYKSLVKRVIAIAGDHLQIIGTDVFLNGNKLEETYINGPMLENYNIDIIVSPNHIFCMGDNRNHSADCRIYGEVSLDTVLGKCWMIKGINGKLRRP